MKNSKLIVQIAGKLVVEGLTPEVVTKEKAVKKTMNCVCSILIHQEIDRNFDDIVTVMAGMTVTLN